MENPVKNSVNPDQMPHNVVSDLGPHCLPYDPFTGFQVKVYSQNTVVYLKLRTP